MKNPHYLGNLDSRARTFKISGRASYVKLRDLDFIFYDIEVAIRSPIAIWDPDNNSSWNFEIPVENKRNRTTNQPNLPQISPQNPISKKVPTDFQERLMTSFKNDSENMSELFFLKSRFCEKFCFGSCWLVVRFRWFSTEISKFHQKLLSGH